MQRLMEHGAFTYSHTIESALEAYRRRSDNILAFIEDNCEFDLNEMTSKQVVYDSYRRQCGDWGNLPFSQSKFNSRLQSAYPEIREHRDSIRRWKGLKLVDREFLQ